MVTRSMSFSLALLMAAHCGDAVAQEPVATFLGPVDDFKELYQKEVPVSGRVVAGITVTGSTAIATLAVLPPAEAEYDRVCIEVVSRDGRYWSRNAFKLPSPIRDWPIRLEYPSAHTEFLENLNADDLAVLGSPGDCDGDDGKNYYVTGSGPANDRPDSISILVNSGRTDTYVAMVIEGQRGRPSGCDPIDAKRRTGFDAVCKVSLTSVDPDESKLTIQILRRRYERMLPPTEFIVVLPGAK